MRDIAEHGIDAVMLEPRRKSVEIAQRVLLKGMSCKPLVRRSQPGQGDFDDGVVGMRDELTG